jgi:predicted GNAT superfamily acetyltransferase
LIRTLSTPAEMQACAELQKQVWGFADADLLPVRLFVVASRIGGQVFGAYDGASLAGFLIAIPGIRPTGEPYLHSHMLGVDPGYRDRGIGLQLKLEQKRDALARGLQHIEWTFDPLALKNAYFNIVRLGAIVRRHLLNPYGVTTNQFDAGLPSDRCVAEWNIAAPRPLATPITARIAVPNNISPIEKPSIQQRVSAEFQHHLAQGLAVVGFERGDTEGAYLLRYLPS